jgi:hypothetical protein
VANRYAPKAYSEKQKAGFYVAAQKQVTSNPAKGGLDSTSAGSNEISQNYLTKTEGGILETENLTQEILNKNSNLLNPCNYKLDPKNEFPTETNSPNAGQMVLPTEYRKTFANFLPGNPAIPVRNSETTFYDVDNHRNQISSQIYQHPPYAYQHPPYAYQHPPYAYQHPPYAYQPQYQESVYAQPQSYAQPRYDYYYYYDYPQTPDPSTAQHSTQIPQNQPQTPQPYYTQDTYMLPSDYYDSPQSDNQAYPGQTGQPLRGQGGLDQGYVRPTGRNGWEKEG